MTRQQAKDLSPELEAMTDKELDILLAEINRFCDLVLEIWQQRKARKVVIET